ncbi:MAG: class I SAM-dependent methyltransferase [Syntrophaceae bacterium]|nr:class I SAM-dependent methyltransferase [Syntrophaceae bacterium]
MIKTVLRNMRNRAVSDHRRCILECLEPSAREVALLDCGCDDGEWTLRAGARIGNARLYGIEIVDERRRHAERKGIAARPGDLNERFPFPDEFFDAVHANQVIEHLADTDRFIGEIRRTLKPGGYAVICTENLAGWHNILSLVLGWQPFSLTNVSERRFQIGNPLALHQGEEAESPGSWQHRRVFSYRGLREIFLVHGFTIERTLGSGYYPLPGFLAKLDPRHAAFLTLKVRKPAGEADGKRRS